MKSLEKGLLGIMNEFSKDDLLGIIQSLLYERENLINANFALQGVERVKVTPGLLFCGLEMCEDGSIREVTPEMVKKRR